MFFFLISTKSWPDPQLNELATDSICELGCQSTPLIEKDIDNIKRFFILEEEQGAEINAVQGQTRIRVAMNSGAVRHVTHPRTLPAGVVMRPNVSGKHFNGAGGEVIERFGACETVTAMTIGAQVVNAWFWPT